jgi:protein-S-isoprenylcysteine O-methyltransferase Ste14
LASFLFLLFPYKFIDLYIRNAFAEYTAMSIAPFVFLGLTLVSSDKIFNKHSFLLLVISGTFFVLSHNLSLMMYSPLFHCFFSFQSDCKKKYSWIKIWNFSRHPNFFAFKFFYFTCLFEVKFIQHSQLLIGPF